MSREIVLSAEARDDIQRIADFIAENNFPAAARFVRDLRKRLRLLSEFPGGGRSRPELGEDVRTFTFHRRFLVAYRFEETTVLVLSVLYAGADYEDILQNRFDASS